MHKVRLTQGITFEYQARDVYQYAWHTGIIELNEDQYKELMEDAIFNSDPEATDMDSSTRRIYKMHLEKLKLSKAGDNK